MTQAAPTYDLVLMLDPQAEQPVRAKIVADALASIEAQGELVRHDEWGERPLSYPIDKHASAEYHLLQLHAPDKELLSGLDRTLRITDGVLRFRIIKLKPGVPSPPDMGSPAARRAESGAEAPVSEEPAAETTAAEAPVAEAPGAEAPGAEAPEPVVAAEPA